MNKKVIGIAIVAVGFFSLILVAYLTFFSGKDNKEKVAPSDSASTGVEMKDAAEVGSDRNPDFGKPDEETGSSTTAINQRKDEWEKSKQATSTTEVAKKAEDSQQSEDLQAMAMSFVERYGSYSNHSNYENVRILMPFMTDRMQVEQDKMIKESVIAGTNIADYNGTTVTALTVNVVSLDEAKGTAVIKVGTVAKRSIGTTVNSETINQEAEVSLAKERNAWKVDKLVWK